MLQKKVKIRDSLKNQYSDFLAFCESLDKQFVSELTISDYIAFRTQYGVTRDYITKIRQSIDSSVSECATQSFDEKDERSKSSEQKKVSSQKIEEFVLDEIDDLDDLDDFDLDDLDDLDLDEDNDNDLVAYDGQDDKISEGGLSTVREATDGMESVNVSSSLRSSSSKAWFNYLEEIQDVDIELPLYDLFGIRRVPVFKTRSINDLGLSVRPYNCLIKVDCWTINSLLSKTLLELSEIESLGKKSLLEIIDKCKEIAQIYSQLSSEDSFADDSPVKTVNIFDAAIKENCENLKRYAKAIASGEKLDLSDTNEAEQYVINLIDLACRTLGEEMCLYALDNPKVISQLKLSIEEYILFQDTLFEVEAIVKRIEKYTFSRNLRFLPFVSALKRKVPFDFRKIFTQEDRLQDIVQSVDRYLRINPQDCVDLLAALHKIENMISSGIDEYLSKGYENAILSDRAQAIIQMRQHGYKLAQIASSFDVTRARIQQIIAKTVTSFSDSIKSAEVRIIDYIHALLDGDLMIHKDEMALCIKNRDHLDLLWACVEDGVFDCKAYKYDKQYKAIVFGHANIAATEKILKSLPEYLFVDELELLIRQAVEEGAWEEKIRADISHRYKVHGKFYFRHRLTVTFVCDWILKNRFVNGYKVNDDTDAKRFLEYASELFGEELSHMTQRAIDAKVSSVGVLCDRGKYIHPSMVNVDPVLLNEIDLYIEESAKNAISFIELFDAFKDRLAGTQISNHYFLQGVIKVFGNSKKRRCQYYVFRDYLTKDLNVSTTDELEAFIFERGIVHKSEILAEFPALTEVTISQVISRCSTVYNIDGGSYIHISQFHIREDDYAPIREYLTKETVDLPVNIRKVYDDCCLLFPEFMDRNGLHNRGILFAILNYMFGNEFRFARPYISNTSDMVLTNRGVVLSILEPYDVIDIDELIDIINEHRIRYHSILYLIQMISPDYIRVNENMLMKRSSAGVDDEVVKQALNILYDSVKINGYLASCKVEDFIWYPPINVPWTPYLLESLVLCNDKIDYIPYTYGRSDKTLSIYVSEKYSRYDLQSFILKVIEEEYEKGTFTRKSDMKGWLLEKGLIDINLPNYLESSNIYYMSEDGILMKREGNN